MNRLGAQLSVHGVDRAQVIRRLLFGALSAGMALFVGWGLTTFSFKSFLNIIYILGGVLLALSALWFVSLALDGLRTWWQSPRITVHEKGVALHTRAGEQSWAWRDFRRMQGSITDFRMFGLLLRTGAWKFYGDDGKPLIVSALFAQAGQLSELVANQIVALRLPDALAALERGESLKFGEVELDRQQFRKGKQHFNWENLRKAGFESGAWVVAYQDAAKNDKTLRVEIGSIPDFPLLARLTNHFLSQQDIFVR